jgi:hypothetical protein
VTRRYYHVTPARNRATILKYGIVPRAGRWLATLEDEYPHEWSARVFLATSLMAAYEVAHDFRWEGHHGLNKGFLAELYDLPDTKPQMLIIVLDRNKIPGLLHRFPDVPVYPGLGVRGRRRRLGTLWTAEVIRPSAIIDVVDVPSEDDLLSSAAFRRWIGADPKPRGRPRKPK